jgi:hypothetical protein
MKKSSEPPERSKGLISMKISRFGIRIHERFEPTALKRNPPNLMRPMPRGIPIK